MENGREYTIRYLFKTSCAGVLCGQFRGEELVLTRRDTGIPDGCTNAEPPCV